MMQYDKLSEKIWKTIADKSLAGIYVHDKDLNLIYVNDIVEKATGYKKEELIGDSVFKIIHPDDRERLERLLKELTSDKFLQYESRYVRKSGEVRWVWGYVTLLSDGLVLGNWIDVTRRKRLEQELIENNELFIALVEESPIPVFITQNDAFAYVNKAFARMLGYRRDELLGKYPIDFVHPEDRDMVEKRYRDRIKGERGAETYSWRVISKTGKTIWVTGRPSKIRYKGEPAIAGVLIDTTDIHELTSMLKKKNEYLSLINRILRHDILNDLTVIRAALEMWDEELKSVAISRIDKIAMLINESKAIEDAVGATYTVNLAEYAKEVGKNYEDIADVTYSLSNVLVRGNESIKSAIDNILRNSIQHSGKERVKIEIDTYANGNYGVVKISDNGVGIREDIKEKIFEKGFSTSGGTGVGLFIVKKVVELLDGKVSVYNNTPSGVTFELSFPRP